MSLSSASHFCQKRAASPSDQAFRDGNESPTTLDDARASSATNAEIMLRPKKPKTLAQIIAEGKAFRAAAMPVARGSGFDKLSQRNDAFLNGTARMDLNKPYPPVVKKAVKVPNRIAKPKKQPRKQVLQKLPSTPIAPTQPPITESWRTAAGAMCSKEGPSVPTPFLGIARVPTFMEQDFKTALRAILDTVGGAEEFATDVHESGGEFYSEISARFVDEEVAGDVLEKINGVLCHGRKLQVSFAPDF